jgi:ferritin-like metal-binding protein YciE
MKTTKAAATKKTTAAKSTGAKKTTSKAKSTATKTAAKTTARRKPADTKEAQGLRELFIEELKDIYWAEKALAKALPKMAKKATSEELISAIEQHQAETENQIMRLEDVFEAIGEKASAKKCEAMAGLIKEAEEIMSEAAKGVVRDAGIISAAQKVEHYEIASYGTLATFAETLGEQEAADLLRETLEEEKKCDLTLTDIAESSINLEAAEEDNEDLEAAE